MDLKLKCSFQGKCDSERADKIIPEKDKFHKFSSHW